MKKSPSKKHSSQLATVIVASPPTVQPPRPQPLPIVGFQYPQHGIGDPVPRILRLTEADARYIRGFQLRHEFDETPGEPKTFERRKVIGPVVLLHLAPAVE